MEENKVNAFEKRIEILGAQLKINYTSKSYSKL